MTRYTMRVYELAKELGMESAALIERLNGLGIAVGSAAAGLSEDEIERARAVATGREAESTQQGGEGEGGPATPASSQREASGKPGQPKGKPKGKPAGYTLTRKGSIQLAGPGHPIIRRGERITPAQWQKLPERLKGHFEAAA